MEDAPRKVVGIDVGTENVRAVVLSASRDGWAVVGYGEARNGGMHKGVVSNLSGPGEALDRMLMEVERMSDYQVNSAYISINGSHVNSTKVSGMIALGADNHEIDESDLIRVEDSAVTGRIPANRKVLSILPLDYTLDGQSGIRDPRGMTGVRLEISANVISALTPNYNNLVKAVGEIAKVQATRIIPSVMAASAAVLSERQRENGVAVIDLGAATTSVAIYEEGDLQYVGVIPMGSSNVTNDLAICLEIDADTAEEVKLKHVSTDFSVSDKEIRAKCGNEEIVFTKSEMNEIVKARLLEIFERVSKLLKAAHYDRRLPEGVVLVGGGAKMRGIDKFAKTVLQTAVKIGSPSGLLGVSESVEKPEFAAAVGLALIAAQDETEALSSHKQSGNKTGISWLKKIFKN